MFLCVNSSNLTMIYTVFNCLASLEVSFFSKIMSKTTKKWPNLPRVSGFISRWSAHLFGIGVYVRLQAKLLVCDARFIAVGCCLLIPP